MSQELGPKGMDVWSQIGIGIVIDAVLIFKMTIVDGLDVSSQVSKVDRVHQGIIDTPRATSCDVGSGRVTTVLRTEVPPDLPWNHNTCGTPNGE